MSVNIRFNIPKKQETAKFLGHGTCDNLSKSSTTSHPIPDAKTIFKEIKKLYEKLNPDYVELRGMGIQLSKLEKNANINPTLNKFLQQESKPKMENDAPPPKSRPPEEKHGRGRPKGSKNKTESKPKQSINTFFKSTKESSSFNLGQFQIKKEDVDLNVLKELPPEIRDEIMKEYDISMMARPPKPELSVDEVEPQPVKKSPFCGLQWHQLKPALYAWMKSEPKPAEVDVEMLGEHFRQLAIKRKIEMLKVALNFLHRNFSPLGCYWHEAYRLIVDLAQQGMVARYGSTLYISKTFDCCCRFVVE